MFYPSNLGNNIRVDVMLQWNLLVVHALPVMFSKNVKAWEKIFVTQSKFEDPDEKFL